MPCIACHLLSSYCAISIFTNSNSHLCPPCPFPPLNPQIKISGTKTSQAVTLLLRGANDMHLDEMDRSLHDALCVVKRVLESGAVVPGG